MTARLRAPCFLAGLAGATLGICSAAHAAPLPIQTTFGANSSQPQQSVQQTWTVPTGVTEVTFYVAGGAGGAGAGGDRGGRGGNGGNLQANFGVVAGQTYEITVGGNGAGGAPSTGCTGDVSGGQGGGRGGGRGGPGSSSPPPFGGGGGGGGQSAVVLRSVSGSAAMVVAPGGGGGGAGDCGASSGGEGGDGGANGTAGSTSGGGGGGGGAGQSTRGGTPGSPGAPGGTGGSQDRGGDGVSGGGGGGDGFFGGGSGGGINGGGAGGGGGGAFYVAATTTESSQLPPATVGQVAIGYQIPPPAAQAPAMPAPPRPRPAIFGTPAVGEPLSCAASPAPASATVRYRWLRDSVPVTGATQPSYVVATGDATHYLQCQITATNAAGSSTGTSAFVAIPQEGVPGSVIPSAVGAVRPGAGGVSVALLCSPQAAGNCRFELLLTLVETLRAGHLVAVAARLPAPAAHSQRVTVRVGRLSVTLAPAQRHTVTVALYAAGVRLLRHEHGRAVRLTVTGTIVGARNGPLHSSRVTLGATPPTSLPRRHR